MLAMELSSAPRGRSFGNAAIGTKRPPDGFELGVTGHLVGQLSWPALSSGSGARPDAAPRTHNFNSREAIQGLPVHKFPGEHTHVRRSVRWGTVRPRREL